MLDDILGDESLIQVANVATLPGIQKYSLAMPDIHEGYGFCIGGVAAMEHPNGVISPGGVGFDINCGVRLLKSEQNFKEIKPNLENLAVKLYGEIPSGVGRSGKLKLKEADLNEVLRKGAERMVELGYGEKEDLEFLESQGKLEDADASFVSSHAKNRGKDQLGTMGAGNHFIEVQKIIEIFNKKIAEIFGLFENQVVIMIHTGSRGLGHQIATDYVKIMLQNAEKYGIKLPDRQLAALPFNSIEGQKYFKAMKCGANFAWANRQVIAWEAGKAWNRIFGSKLKTVYDVAHNIAKVELFDFGDKSQIQNSKLLVHRKGATRAFPAGHPEIPEKYREAGQPVLIPGSMGTSSYVLVGVQKAMKDSFGSACHGAGRRMSRHAALRKVRGEELKTTLESQGIIVKSGSWRGLAEEAPLAYKDIDDVVDVVQKAGLAEKVAKLKPLAVIKG
jgi:tRNA-splicing ligase RtcB